MVHFHCRNSFHFTEHEPGEGSLNDHQDSGFPGCTLGSDLYITAVEKILDRIEESSKKLIVNSLLNLPLSILYLIPGFSHLNRFLGLGWNDFSGTNTQPNAGLVKNINRLITFIPTTAFFVAHVIVLNLFSSSLTLLQNKLECLSHVSFLGLVKYLQVWLWIYL